MWISILAQEPEQCLLWYSPEWSQSFPDSWSTFVWPPNNHHFQLLPFYVSRHSHILIFLFLLVYYFFLQQLTQAVFVKCKLNSILILFSNTWPSPTHKLTWPAHKQTANNDPTVWGRGVYIPRATGDTSETKWPRTPRTQVSVMTLINTAETETGGRGDKRTSHKCLWMGL